MAQAQQVIELLTDEKGSTIHNERAAAAGSTIVPGDLVEVTSGDEVQEHSTAQGAAQNAYALTDLPVAGTIDDTYAVGATVRYGIAHSGQEINGRVAVGAPAIAIGDALESAGDGTLQAFTTGVILGYANEAVDNSAGSVVVRISFNVA